MVRERPSRLASRRPGSSGSDAPKPDSRVGAVLSVEVHAAAPAGSAHTISVFERTASERSAFSRKPPSSLNVRVATPSLPVVAPPTLALAAGLEVCVSVTCTFNGWPTVAVGGPVRRSTAVFEKASKAQTASSPCVSLVWQPPELANCPFTTRPQNCDEFADSSPTRVTAKSSKLWNQSASQLMLCARVTSSRAAVGVGTGDGWAPPLVPSHLWVPPEAGVTSWPSVVTGSSRIVWLAPSTRMVTPTGAESAVLRRRSVIEPPLPRGSCGLRPESGLLAPSSAPRLPGEPSAPQWLHAMHLRRFTVAGPRGIHTRLPSTTGR